VEPEDAQETPAAEVPKLDSVESGGDCHDDDGADGNAAVADVVKTPAAVRAPKSTSTSTRASQAPPVGAASAAASTLSETLAVRLSRPPKFLCSGAFAPACPPASTHTWRASGRTCRRCTLRCGW
jgi:hypothetical protein